MVNLVIEIFETMPKNNIVLLNNTYQGGGSSVRSHSDYLETYQLSIGVCGDYNGSGWFWQLDN
jgi:hypothetical protein